MTLLVLTARIGHRDPDAFDVTRKSGGPAGAPFAPSWLTLKPCLAARAAARLARARGDHAIADELEVIAWERYVPRFFAEMRASYRAHHRAWEALLARPRVVLVCYCSAADAAAGRCHRVVLRRDILPKLGAADGGELAP